MNALKEQETFLDCILAMREQMEAKLETQIWERTYHLTAHPTVIADLAWYFLLKFMQDVA
jgi:hypothetical protein